MENLDNVNNSNASKLASMDNLIVKRELLFKILILGDFGVGKTSIIQRYAEGTFSPTYKITIGADFAVKTIEWDSSTKINLQLWDIAGHERFGCLTGVYYRYAVAAAIVFDLTRPETFSSIQKWLTDLRGKVALENGNPIPVIILANKADIDTNVPPQIMDFCRNNKILQWFITSAKENSNIDKAMNILINTVVENYENNLVNSGQELISLGNIPPKEPQKRAKCCQQ